VSVLLNTTVSGADRYPTLLRGRLSPHCEQSTQLPPPMISDGMKPDLISCKTSMTESDFDVALPSPQPWRNDAELCSAKSFTTGSPVSITSVDSLVTASST
jgi:hypothetical protein